MDGTRSVAVKVKAVGPDGGLGDGEFKALVSVFDVTDRYRDVVRPGAFADTLAAWKASGDPIPVLWSHDWADPFSHIGEVLEAAETAEGLLVHGRIDTDGNPKAAQVYRLLKGRRVKEFSFAYDIVEGGWATHDGEEVYELAKLDLIEVGPCLIGVNPETQLLAVKAADALATAKAGRLDADSLEAVRKAQDTLAQVLELAKAEDLAEPPAATPEVPPAELEAAADAAADDDAEDTAPDALEGVEDDAADDAADALAAIAGDGDETSPPEGSGEGDSDPAGAAGDSEDGQPAADTATDPADAAPSPDPSAAETDSTPAQDLAELQLLAL